MQDLIRKLPGVVSTHVGYSGGELPTATYRTTATTLRRSRSSLTPPSVIEGTIRFDDELYISTKVSLQQLIEAGR
jgi:hypothetical protein